MRRLTAATVALFATLGLSACGTSFDAQTNQQYQAGVGTDERSGDVDLLAALLVDNGDGTATLSGSLINNSGEDLELANVVVAGFTVSGDEKAELPNGEAVRLGVEGGPVAVVTDSPGPGRYVELTLRFSDATSLSVSIPVVERTEVYDAVVGGSAESAPADEAEEHAEEAAH